ncbi:MULTISPECIES: DUF4083 domain-containing protein [Paraliobacillus]|uniref:DUF4083 domain-containing protein n=1 Tax=Paraliobacillus TaxID=200903 RepID=UPI000DD45EC8|nr:MULTISPECIES: DUF4083 domain-containing protein [Paraliobacillus]
MFLAIGVGGFNTGDILFSLVSFIGMIVFIIFIILIVKLFISSINRKSDLTRIEEKLDTLLKEKEKL